MKAEIKLTKSEYKALIKIWENSSHIYNDYSFIKILKDNELVEIKDTNKFRKFLNDEMELSFTMDLYDIELHKNLKSILYKLDK